VPLEQPQDRPLRLDDLPVADDLLLRAGDVPDDLLRLALLDVVLDRVELVPDLVEDREAVVEEVVEDVVEQVARPLPEKAVAEPVVVSAALEEPRDREQLDRRQGHEVAVAEEDVELAGVEPLRGLVVDREVEDDEAVVLVLVDLRPLALGEDVLDVERMPAEALGEPGRLVLRGRVEVDPDQASGICAELSGLARRRR
jgi:hypothetical protein